MPGQTTQTDRRSNLFAGPGADALDPRGGRKPGEADYYGISHLQAPLWHWEIAWYFYLGGMSGGAYLLGRLAERFGGDRYRDLSKMASYVAFAALMPCPPLLILDLGDPKRFHHMLRVFKPSTPMNLGTWVIMGYSGAATAAVAKAFLEGDRTPKQRSLAGKLANASVLAVTDAAGMPLAVMLVSYTGVLLSCTSNPMWTKNTWLAPLFASSAIATGASAISLALDLAGKGLGNPSRYALEKIDTAAHIAEAATLVGYLRQAGPLAEPITKGRYKHHLWFAGISMLFAELMKFLPLPRRAKRRAGTFGTIVSLLGGLSLRWAFVHGGHDAAMDARLARRSSRPSSNTGGGSDVVGARTDMPAAASSVAHHVIDAS